MRCFSSGSILFLLGFYIERKYLLNCKKSLKKYIMKNLIALLFLFVSAAKMNAQTAPLPESKHKFIVIAHRGDHVDVPENTIAAFENGIKNDVDYVEIDLRTSKDSVLVIMHDAT